MAGFNLKITCGCSFKTSSINEAADHCDALNHTMRIEGTVAPGNLAGLKVKLALEELSRKSIIEQGNVQRAGYKEQMRVNPLGLKTVKPAPVKVVKVTKQPVLPVVEVAAIEVVDTYFSFMRERLSHKKAL